MQDRGGNQSRPAMPGPGGRGPGGPGGPMRGVIFEKPKNLKGSFMRLLGFLKGDLPKILLVSGLSVFTAGVGVVSTRVYGLAIDQYILPGDLAGLTRLCLGLLVLFLANAAATYFQNIKTVEIAQFTSKRLRETLFGDMQALPLKFFDTRPSGDLMSRLSNDIDTISGMLSANMTQLFSGVISVLGALVAMLLLSPMLTLISMLTIPLTILLTRLLAGRMRGLYKAQQAKLGLLNGYVEEMVSGQKVVKLFSHEAETKAEFARQNEELRLSGTKAEIVGGVMGPLMNLINNFSYLVVAVAGGWMILGQGAITVGVVFSFLLYMKNFGRPLNEIANLFNTIQSALAAAERVFAILDEEPERDAPEAKGDLTVEGDIEFKGVNFSYLPGTPVLKNANLLAKKGQQIAIVGPTGAGKTTIISLLTRFYDKESGEILIDGRPIETITRDCLRDNIGMVLQDTFLFSESVRDNLRYAKPSASDEEVEQAAKTGGADAFIRHLPEGYDTILSDNGGNLSQGQRQLLAISRAVLSDPRLLILDEATSSIDTRTELMIQEAMLELMKGRTAFIIAHRLSTIRGADQILVIDQGEIIESGAHAELLEKGGFYAKLYNSQYATGLVE
ncbi:MAG: ABC transporter ATP-binding protein/permease [Christensenellaceae bacterium]|nr:ABC transporter ATP-binding protein/permease [Christensenellaceae bacterium]